MLSLMVVNVIERNFNNPAEDADESLGSIIEGDLNDHLLRSMILSINTFKFFPLGLYNL